MSEPQAPEPAIHRLAVAKSGYKQRMLERLDEIRQAVERDETISLFVGEIQPNREFLVTSVGDVKGLEALGLLHRMMHYVHKSFEESLP